MKKVYLSILAIVATLSLVGGATYALFSNKATSGPNTFATGNADLKIDRKGDGLGFQNKVVGIDFSNIYPGWNSGNEYQVWFRNDSTSPITLSVYPEVVAHAWTNGSVYDNVYLQFFLGDGTTPANRCGNVPLRWWMNNPDTFTLGDLTQGQKRGPWIARFSIPYKTEDQNWMQEQSIKFDVVFNGIQVTP